MNSREFRFLGALSSTHPNETLIPMSRNYYISSNASFPPCLMWKSPEAQVSSKTLRVWSYLVFPAVTFAGETMVGTSLANDGPFFAPAWVGFFTPSDFFGGGCFLGSVEVLFFSPPRFNWTRRPLEVSDLLIWDGWRQDLDTWPFGPLVAVCK